MAVDALIDMSIARQDVDQLLQWSDRVLQLDQLPRVTRLRWLAIKMAVQARAADWPGVEKTATMMLDLDPKATTSAVVRIAALVRNGKVDAAVTALKGHSDLMRSDTGARLALALGVEAPLDAPLSPLTKYLVAVHKRDWAAARAVAGAAGVLNNVVYGGDLLRDVEHLELLPQGKILPAADLALAAAILDVQIPAMAEPLVAKLAADWPRLSLAHGLHASSLYSQRKPMAAAIKEIKTHCPQSTLALYLDFQYPSKDTTPADIAKSGQQLVEREPAHDFVSHKLAGILASVGRVDDAVAILQKLAGKPGGFQVAAANDLAFLLAAHFPQRLSEAKEAALFAHKASPDFAPFNDTLGWVEHLQGNNSVSITYLLRALSRHPQSIETHYHVGIVYAALGQTAWARHHLTVVASAGPGENYAKDATERLKQLKG